MRKTDGFNGVIAIQKTAWGNRVNQSGEKGAEIDRFLRIGIRLENHSEPSNSVVVDFNFPSAMLIIESIIEATGPYPGHKAQEILKMLQQAVMRVMPGEEI